MKRRINRLMLFLLITVFITGTLFAQINKELKPRQLIKGCPVVMENGRQYRIIIKFNDEIKGRCDNKKTLYSKIEEKLTSGKINQLKELNKIKKAYGVQFSKALSAPEEHIQRVIERAEKLSGEAQPDLAGFIALELDEPGNVKKIAKLLAQLEKIDIIEFIQVQDLHPSFLLPGDIYPTTPDLVSEQTFRGPNPGIDAHFSFAYDAKGDGIRVTDCEFSFNPNHEDLVDVAIGLDPRVTLRSSSRTDYHGTAVLGILGAPDNGYGITGICPEADLYFYSEDDSSGLSRRAEAVFYAITDSAPGDIVLLEMQNGEAPAETDGFLYTVVKIGVNSGIIVVAAAGNGNHDLDSLAYAEYMSRPDSGAIIVGEGKTDIFHSKNSESTYGSRVDVQAWGSGVLTIGTSGYDGYVDGYGNDENQTYGYFGGTSAASAQVAGACAVIQSEAVETLNRRLTPAEMRKLLISTGLPQDKGGHIGPIVSISRALLTLWAHDNGVLNYPPVVDAGDDTEVYVPSNTVNLSGSADDDTIPQGASLSYAWSKISGPGTVAFGNTNAASTTAHFSLWGEYRLRLVVNDTETSSYDDIVVTYRPAGDLRVLHLNNNINFTTNTLELWFQIENTGTTSIDLEDITIRYWFTKDGTAEQYSSCNYADFGSINVIHTIVEVNPPLMMADHYLELTFSGSAGSIAPGQLSGEIRMNIYKIDLTDYSQTNDFSYFPGTSYAPQTTITAYIEDYHIYGTEP